MLIKSASDWNVVHMLLGGVPVIEGLVYLLVGLAAIKVFLCRCKTCKVSRMSEETAKTM